MPTKPTGDRERAILAAFQATGSKRGAMRETGASWNLVNRIMKTVGGDGASLAGVAGQQAASDPAQDPGPPQAIYNPDAIVARLRRGPLTVEEIASLGRCSKMAAADWLDVQRGAGLNLQAFNGQWVIERQPPAIIGPVVEIVSDDDDTFTLGAMGDTHLGSKYERLDVLNSLYDRYAAEGVRHVFHAGNWIDGEAPFNRYDLHTHGMDAQVAYLVREYPRRPGVHTYAVAGDDHEGWYCQRNGVNIGWYAEAAMRKHGRDDWTDLGYMESFVRLVNRRSGQTSMLAVVHPGGGSAYALSYTVQKIVESYAGGEKPAVLFAGHYHKMELANIRNVWTVQTGCTQDQTPFMRKKRLEAHVGGHVIRLKQDPATGAIVEMNGMCRYFNSGYYNSRWSHAGGVNLPRRTQGGV